MTTVAAALKETTEAIRAAAQEEAPQQARILLAHVLGVPVGTLALCREKTLTSAQNELLCALIARRQAREPLQYILGAWSFMGLPFVVRPGVLIPRPETELLCETALRLAKENGYETALDLCCGTGCVGVALAKIGSLRVTASDCEADCVTLTKENAAKNDVSLTVLQGDWFSPHTERFDMIVCNPPYLTAEDMRALQEELRYEPLRALFGGEDGLCAYRIIAERYREYLNAGGALILEVGHKQAEDVRTLLGGQAEVLEDLSGIHRVVYLQI
ncbi:peptide chain release factor N(5)-glutamine methyltransferase [Christensenellaceae bacterium OttesenSCG-928-L17]|nr:peptide chain release factor N(5)-glutamine methyltransferase [Christensenellaceae bacterium OttesenSCG-928-L17]